LKVLAIATVVGLGFVGTSSANPLDSPGTIYIDGLPCNLPCQHYLEWSRQTLEAGQPAGKRAAKTSVARESGKATGTRIAKRPEPMSAGRPRHKVRDLQATLKATPDVPHVSTSRTETPVDMKTGNSPAPLAGPQPVSKPETGNAPLAVDSGNPPEEKKKSVQDVVLAALSVAEQITNAELPKALGSDHTETSKVDETPASGLLVALVLSRPELKSASALNNQDVAIDKAESTIESDIRSALAATGATEARLSVSDTSPLDRLVNGDVQAALVKLVSPDAAEAFPEIKGYRVFRVPLFAR
jgi:hypothetical protein